MILSKHISRRTEWLLVAGLLLLAGWLRMGWPALTEFKADEARLLKLALEMASGQQFPLRGISSSVGLPNFPVNVWVYALPLVFWRSVLAPTLFTGLLNTLAVGLCYAFTRRYWGWRTAFVATLLFAVAPWAVVHSRKIWAQNLLPFFVLVWAFGLTLSLFDQKKWWLALSLLSSVLAFQIHLAALTLFPITAAMLLLYRRRIDWRGLWLGIALSLLSLLPFTLYLLGRDPAALDAAAAAAGGGESGLRFSLNAFAHLWRLTTGWQLHALAGPQAFEAYLARVSFWLWAPWLVGAFFLLGIWVVGGEMWRARRPGLHAWLEQPGTPAPLFLLLWTALTPLTYLVFPTEVVLHYLLPLYPAPFILAARGLLRLGRWLRGGEWLLLGATSMAQIILFLTLLNFVATVPTPGGFGTPLAIQLEAVAALQALPGEDMLLVGPGDNPQLDSFPAIFEVLLWPEAVRFVDGERHVVVPEAGARLLIAPELDWATESYTALSRETPTAVPLRDPTTAFHILSLPAGVTLTPQIPYDPPPLLANFVRLQGYAPFDPQTGVWEIVWTAGEAYAPDYHIFNHLISASGERVAQADAPAFDSSQWRAGDQIRSRFILEGEWAQAERPLQLRTGMYIFSSGENVPVLDANAQPTADGVTITLDE